MPAGNLPLLPLLPIHRTPSAHLINENSINSINKNATGLYGKPSLGEHKWFHQFKPKNLAKSLITNLFGKKLNPDEKKFKLEMLENIWKKQSLNAEETKSLQQTWADILNVRQLPKKQRAKQLKTMLPKSLQAEPKTYQKIKNQWRAGGGIWGGGIGMPYLLLSAGSYLGVFGKVFLSIVGTAVSAWPNAYLEIALETFMGMIYDAEPKPCNKIMNAASYQYINKNLNQNTLKKLLENLKRCELEVKQLKNSTKNSINNSINNSIIDQKEIKIKEAQTLLNHAIEGLINYIVPYMDEYTKQNAQTKAGFCDSSRAIVSGCGLILAASLNAAGVAGTLHLPPLGLSLIVLSATLFARIIASMGDKARLRECRIMNNLKYAEVRTDEAFERSNMLDVQRKFTELENIKDIKNLTYHYKADDIDSKKVLKLWQTGIQTRNTWMEKIIAARLSKHQVKIEENLNKFLQNNLNDLNNLDNSNPRKPLTLISAEIKNYFKDLEELNQISQTSQMNQIDQSNLSDEDKKRLQKKLKERTTEILQTQEILFNNIEEIIKNNKNNKNNKKDLENLKCLENIISSKNKKTFLLQEFTKFKNTNFTALDPNSVIYKCLLNDRFFAKKATAARFKIAGVVVSQGFRNIGSYLATIGLSPLVLNSADLIKESLGGPDVTAAKLTATAAVGTIGSSLASHHKHFVQANWAKPEEAETIASEKHPSTLRTIFYMDANQNIQIIDIKNIAPTYNKIYSFKERAKHLLKIAYEVAFLVPIKNPYYLIRTFITTQKAMRAIAAHKKLYEDYFAPS